MCSNVVDCRAVIRFENTNILFHVFSLRIRQWSAYTQHTWYIEENFRWMEFISVLGAEKRLPQLHYKGITAIQKQHTESNVSTGKRIISTVRCILLCVNSLIFAVDTVQCSSVSGKNGRFIFSENETHILSYTVHTHHVSGIFSFSMCLLGCHLSFISFPFSMVGLGQNHSCLPRTQMHTHIHTNANKNTSFSALWQLFSCLPNAYIFITMLGENLISSARKIPHFHYEQRLQCSRVNHHVADRKYKRNVASDIVDVFLFVCKCGFWKTEISHLLKYTHIHSSCSSDDGNNFCQSLTPISIPQERPIQPTHPSPVSNFILFPFAWLYLHFSTRKTTMRK